MKRTGHAASFLTLGLLLAAPAAPLSAQVLVSEIMYNPAGPDYHTEFVELYNAGASPVLLSGWSLGDGEALDALTAAPGQLEMTLAPGSYAVVLDPGYWTDGGGIYDDAIPDTALLLTVPDAAIGSGGLGNSSAETVTLYDLGGSPVSSRTYRPGAPDGRSEERLQMEEDGEDANWAFSLVPGGTPGAPNSVVPPPQDLAVEVLLLALEGGPGPEGSEVTATAEVRNVGTEAHGEALLELELARVHYTEAGHEPLRWTVELPALAAGGADTVAVAADSLPGGLWQLAATLPGGDDRPANDRDSLALDLPHRYGAARIVEVYGATTAERSEEWVELAPGGAEGVELRGWTLRDDAGGEAELPAWQSAWTGAGAPLVAAEDSAVLALWPTLGDSTLAVPHAWTGLNDEGETLSLLDPTGTLVDSVVLPAFTPGRSLWRERIASPPGAGDWRLMPAEVGGTPGSPHVPPPGLDLALDSLTVRTAPAHGEGGGEASLVLHLRNVGQVGGWASPRLDLLRHAVQQVVELELDSLPLEPGERDSIAVGPLPLEPGRWLFVARIAPDEGPEDNVAAVEAALPWPPRTLTLSEVMPTPAEGPEWVELASTASEPVPLAGWSLTDEAGHRGQAGYGLGLAGVGPGERAVLTADCTAFLAAWPGVSPATVFPLQPWPALNDDGEGLALRGPAGALADSATLPPADRGTALVRVDPGSPGVQAWQNSQDPAGGSPGLPDTLQDGGEQAEGAEVEVHPNPFSPDGDGHEDRAVFSYRFPAEEVEATLRIFDSRGRLVATPLERSRLPGSGQWAWDGRRGLNRGRLPLGLYVWHMEVRERGGAGRWTLRGTLATTGAR